VLFKKDLKALPEVYRGKRDTDSFVNWLTDKTNDHSHTSGTTAPQSTTDSSHTALTQTEEPSPHATKLPPIPSDVREKAKKSQAAQSSPTRHSEATPSTRPQVADVKLQQTTSIGADKEVSAAKSIPTTVHEDIDSTDEGTFLGEG
jgi:hypothetical protein